MSDLLFGWINRPHYLVSFLDVVIALVMILPLIFIGYKTVLFYQRLYMKSHQYNIRTRKWEKRK